jgi:dUTP pyrophosphatase
MEVRAFVKRLHPEATLPIYAHGSQEDAGLDLTYCGTEALVLPAGTRVMCPTGIAIQLPPGFEGQIRPKSGLALNRGLTVLNAPGTVDPGYRGEIAVLLINLSNEQQKIVPGDRIAQLVVSQYAELRLEEVQKLDESERNSGGFGSSGI